MTDTLAEELGTHEEELLAAAEDDKVFPENAIAQHYSDLQAVSGALMQMRQMLSDLKTQHILMTRVGLHTRGKNHPSQQKNEATEVAEEIKRLVKSIEVLTELITDLRTGDEVATLPMPSGLEIVTASL